MSYCRWGNSVIPDFYIFPTSDEDGEDVLAIYVSDSRQKLEIWQVKFILEILESWLCSASVRDMVGGGSEQCGCRVSSKTEADGRIILSLILPSIHTELSKGQALCLVSLLKSELEAIRKG